MTMTAQKPSMGRIVLYQRHGSPDGTHAPEQSPAIITKVIDGETGLCSLTVFNPNGFYMNACEYSEDLVAGTWSWPPRI